MDDAGENDEEKQQQRCPVCYEDLLLSSPVVSDDIESSLPPAGTDDDGNNQCLKDGVLLHEGCIVVCRSCLTEFVTFQITEKTVPIPCLSQECEVVLSRSLVEDALQHASKTTTSTTSKDDSSSFFNKMLLQYNRLERLEENPSLVVCPRCDELVDPNDQHQQKHYQHHQLKCPACQHGFCQIHGDGHAGMSCRDYRKTADAQQVLRTERALHTWTKPCSHCGVRLQKSRGCNLITCGNCRRVMCYMCGSHEYLQGKRIFRCTRCESLVEGHCNCGPVIDLLLIVLGLTVYFLVASVWAVVLSLAAILSGCFCGFFRCGKDLKRSVVLAGGSNDGDDGRHQWGRRWLRGFVAVWVVIFVFFLRLIELYTPDFVDDWIPSRFDFLRELSPEIPVLDRTSEEHSSEDFTMTTAAAPGDGNHDNNHFVQEA